MPNSFFYANNANNANKTTPTSNHAAAQTVVGKLTDAEGTLERIFSIKQAPIIGVAINVVQNCRNNVTNIVKQSNVANQIDENNNSSPKLV